MGVFTVFFEKLAISNLDYDDSNCSQSISSLNINITLHCIIGAVLCETGTSYFGKKQRNKNIKTGEKK